MSDKQTINPGFMTYTLIPNYDPACPICCCHNGPMGILGYLAHYTCRDCGSEYTHDLRADRYKGS